MFIGKAKSVIQIGIIENDVAMQVRFIIVNSKHILVVALQETVAQFLTNLQGLFGCNFIRSKALNYVVCEDLCPSCSVGSDCSEVGGSTDTVGSAGIRLHI